MPFRARLVRQLSVSGLVVLFAVLLAHTNLSGQVAATPRAGKGSLTQGNFDIRQAGSQRTDLLRQLAPGSSSGEMLAVVRKTSDAVTRLGHDLPGVTVNVSSATGAAETVRNPRGLLTTAAGGDSRTVVRSFLQTHADIYGLSAADTSTVQLRAESVNAGNGLRMLRGEQVINGIPVFGSSARFILDRQHRLIRTLGTFVPSATTAAAGAPAISSSQALITAMDAVGISLTAGSISATIDGSQEQLTVSDARIRGPVTSSLVYFPIAPGVVTLGYQQFTFTDGPGDYLTVVDATTGALLWRKNARAYQTAPTQDARFGVYVQADGVTPADSPSPLSPTTALPGGGTQPSEISRTNVSMFTAQDLIASPAGWLDDNVTTTQGNNVTACLDAQGGANANICDTNAGFVLDGNGRPVGNPDTNSNNRDFLGTTPRSFGAQPPPVAGNPEAGQTATGNGNNGTLPVDALRRAMLTQLFYDVNWFHDQLYRLGFDEAAGNFQTTNFSGQGLGNDPVMAEADDSSGTNISNFSTPPDGTRGRMQLFRFTGPTIDRDGAFDTETVLHELTHGVSGRLMGNGSGLFYSPGAGMGEGWSDFIALSLLNNTQADDPDGQYAFGAYSYYKFNAGFLDNYVYGQRRFPYSTDNSVNPLTWADVDDVTRDYSGGIAISPLGLEQRGGLELHNVGEVWALTLWEVRSRIIHDPAGANGNVPVGNHTMLQLVIDAMKMTPANPTFIEARDALIDADCATNACANEQSIWGGFADRGLGDGARAPLAFTGLGSGSGYTNHMSVATSFAMPNLDVASVAIDDSLGNNNGAVDPGEPIRLTLDLINPYHNAAFNVPNATATLTTSTPGVTIVTGSATWAAVPVQGTVSGTAFKFRLDQSLICGNAIDFTLTVTSALGTTSSPVVVRVGTRSGTDPVITYTRTESPGLAIPDANALGVTSSLNITDDFEIANLDFRLDNLTHTFSGDVSVLLRSPSGYGTDLIWAVGGLIDGGSGDNYVNTVISDQATGQLLIAQPSDAPYTNTWLPAWNQPAELTAGFPIVDPVGVMSRFNGSRTKGNWVLQVADAFAVDTGTLNSWSMLVTPVHFACTAFVDTLPPVTTVTVTPPAPTGNNGWYTTAPVHAAVAATDLGGGGLDDTRCVIDPGAAPAAFSDLPAGCGFTGPGADVTADGLHTLYGASLDGSGNAETPVLASFKIDRTPPVVSCVLPAPTFTTNQANAQVSALVADTLSGPAAASVSAAADTSTTGTKTAMVTGFDLAGNSASVSCAYTVAAPPLTTTVTVASPTTGPTYAATSPFLSIGGTAADDRGITGVTWSNDRGGSGTATGTLAWNVKAIPLQRGTNVITVTATNGGGGTATATLTATFDALTYYLAEGSTGGFFSMDVALANPHATAAHLTLTFLKGDGSTLVQDKTLPPTSRTTVHVNDIPGLEATPVSLIVSSLDVLPIGVERTMSWDASAYGGSGETAVDQPRMKWYFAEGSQGFFHTYLVLLNPNAAPATATVTFLPETGAPVVKTMPMPALSRLVIDGVDVPEIADQSFGITVDATVPIVAERSMYFGGTATRPFIGGHASAGAPDPGLTWYFAEGATGSFFDSYLLLSNPGSTAAQVTLTYLLDNGTTVTTHKTIAASARLTVSVEGEDATLANAAFSTTVTSDVPIVAERSMYWVGDPPPWTEGHNSVGLTAPGQKWLLAEGRVGGPLAYQTYILLGNPSTTAANVTITYLRTDGTVVTGTYVVPPTSRYNVFVNGAVPALQDESFGAVVTVTNGVDIFVERSLYWNAGGVIWAGGTNATAVHLP